MATSRAPIILSIGLIAIALILLSLGLYGHQKVLGANKCEMTYSRPSFVKINLKSRTDAFSLFIEDSTKTRKNDKLNPIPVLLVPGNNGKCVTIVLLISFITYLVLNKADQLHHKCIMMDRFSILYWILQAQNLPRMDQL